MSGCGSAASVRLFTPRSRVTKRSSRWSRWDVALASCQEATCLRTRAADCGAAGATEVPYPACASGRAPCRTRSLPLCGMRDQPGERTDSNLMWAGPGGPSGYVLGSYRIATAPEPNSSRLTSRCPLRGIVAAHDGRSAMVVQSPAMARQAARSPCFHDVEGSTRLWERKTSAMSASGSPRRDRPRPRTARRPCVQDLGRRVLRRLRHRR